MRDALSSDATPGSLADPLAAPAPAARAAESDAALELRLDVQRCSRGDLAAFERIYRRCVPRVHSLARRLLGAPHADDATQEVFLRAWRHRADFRGQSEYATWLFRLAVRVALEHRRRLDRGGSEAGEEVEVAASLAHHDHARLDLDAAVERLPRGAREVFVLHDVEGWLHAEIAAELSVSTGTSKSQLHRARMLLRRALGPQGGTP